MSDPALKILLLEDNPTHRKVCAFNLTKAGYHVTLAGLAADALLLAKRQAFDIVFTDYYLPDYPGTDFIRLLRQVDGYESTPAILLTGRAEELNADKLRDELLVSVLSEPCDIVTLLETVTKSLADAHCMA